MDKDLRPGVNDSPGLETDGPVDRAEHRCRSHDGGAGGDPAEHSRRNFLKMGVGALGVLAALEIGGASVLFVQSRDEVGEYGGVVQVGKAEGFAPGSVIEFPDAGFFLIRSQDGGFLAVHRRCPHLGCTVDWMPGYEQFFCPCHGSTFDFYGNFEGPPVPRPLDTFPVHIEDGKVKVDTHRPQMRERFSPEQLAYDERAHSGTGSSSAVQSSAVAEAA